MTKVVGATQWHSVGPWKADAPYFMPPYEWYNAQVSTWTAEHGLTLVNFTPGTRSNADYTTPAMGDRYVPSALYPAQNAVLCERRADWITRDLVDRRPPETRVIKQTYYNIGDRR